MSNSLLIKKINSQRSPIKPKFIFKNDILRNSNKFISNKEGTKDKNDSNKNITKEIIVKNICSYDKKVWVSIKYIISETSKQQFSKIKVRKRLISLKDNKNIFLNCDLDSLKPIRTDSIELISPLSLLNAHIENNNDNDNINDNDNNNINDTNSDEDKVNNITSNLNSNSDNNSKEKIEKLIDILHNYEKQNISYFYNHFFDLLNTPESDSNLIFSSPKDIFKNIKNNFENTDSDIFNLSNNMNTNEVDKNNSSDKEDNSNNNNKDINNNKNNHKTLQVKCKRKLFTHRRNPRLMSDDDTKNNERENKLNKSLDERIDSLENERMNLNISGNYIPRKTKSFRIKITKCKILRETIQEKSKIINLKTDIKKNVLNDEKDMRKKSVLTLLLTNKFSPFNNKLRLIRNYFQFWKLKNNKDESDMNNNNNSRNDINNLNSENMDKKENENTFINDEALKINDMMENNTIKREKNNSSKEIHFDVNELEERIEYLRIFLINYIFKKSINSEEDEEEKIQ